MHRLTLSEIRQRILKEAPLFKPNDIIPFDTFDIFCRDAKVSRLDQRKELQNLNPIPLTVAAKRST